MPCTHPRGTYHAGQSSNSKRKYDYEQGEPELWDRVLQTVNDLKSEVCGFRKLLIERDIMHADPPRRSNQQGAAGKENVRDPKSKNHRPDKFAGTAAKGKGINVGQPGMERVEGGDFGGPSQDGPGPRWGKF